LLVSAFVAVSGYSYYLSSMQTHNTMAMNYYIQYLDSLESNDAHSAHTTLSLLQKKYTSHLYSCLATLTDSAKKIHSRESLEEAKHQLHWVSTYSPVPFFKDIAHYKRAEIAKIELKDDELRHQVSLIQSPEIQILGQNLLAASLAEEGQFEESSAIYQNLLASCDDPVYKALLTHEYHVVSLLDA